MELLDTSVWILTFRADDPLDLDAIVDVDDAATCLPVVQEVLQGFRTERALRLARESLFAMRVLDDPLGRERLVEAVQLYRAARRSGVTVRSSVDCLIAATAIAHDVVVVHRDRDYDHLQRISPLRTRRI